MQSNCWILTVWVIPIITIAECSWGSPGSGQYHIQTDEGPERYFRFQTDNGQFRKEKRLQDGTVIGTEAWIDAAGFLRQKDYIADTKGYRILKSKTIFVGQGRPIEDAIKSTKSTPAQSGVLVDGRTGGLNSVSHSGKHTGGYIYSTTPAPIPINSISTTPESPRLGYLSPAEAAKIEPSPYLGFDHYPDELAQIQPHKSAHDYRTHHQYQPVIHIRPHGNPILEDDQSNSIVNNVYHDALLPPHSPTHRHHQLVSSTTARPPAPSLPALGMEPPFERTYRRHRPIAVIPTTPSPITAHEVEHVTSTVATPYEPRGSYGYSTPAPFAPAVVSSSPRPDFYKANGGYHYAPSSTPNYAASAYESSTRAPTAALPFDVNNLEDGGLLPPPLPTTHRRRLRPQQLSNTIAASYEPPQQEVYDGVGVTRNGFRYFLPRQYHEEEQIDEQKRAGSFGYVDPFGIRRVVYYNASPEKGFVHRNSNRYVGLGATPYDPRPEIPFEY